MKSVIIAAIVFIIIIALSVCGYVLATGFADKMLSDMTEIRKALAQSDYKAVSEVATRCEKRLKKSNVWLAALANHEELRNMKTGLMRLIQYSEESDAAEAKAQLAELTGLFDHFYESEQISVQNLF